MAEREILHQYQENGLIHYILSSEAVKPKNFDEKSIWIRAEVIIKILRPLSANGGLLGFDGLEDELMVVGREEKLSAFAALGVGLLLDEGEVLADVEGGEEIDLFVPEEPAVVLRSVDYDLVFQCFEAS